LAKQKFTPPSKQADNKPATRAGIPKFSAEHQKGSHFYQPFLGCSKPNIQKYALDTLSDAQQ
jgi:hypothetical protein